MKMSKKTKNLRRKKSNNLLKGVAAAGAVVGGALFLQATMQFMLQRMNKM